MIDFCQKATISRDKFGKNELHKCWDQKGHSGKCREFPFLDHLREVAPRVANKIKRDATMTTGASWKSEDAGPNRIVRWAMLLSDDELLAYGLKMRGLRPVIVAKLREKAARYEECMGCAVKLAHLAYGMANAPTPPPHIASHLTAACGSIVPGATHCLICREGLDFNAFARAVRGKAVIETSHKDPRLHSPSNIGFAHRDCNIAQGGKSLLEFYEWIEGILVRARASREL